jgi:hypothetical protein
VRRIISLHPIALLLLPVTDINMAAIQATQLQDQHFIRTIAVVHLIIIFLAWTALYLAGPEFDSQSGDSISPL